MTHKKGSKGFYYFLATALGWSLVLAGLLAWNISEAREQMINQATIQTRTFFHEFIMTRFWNAMHGGIYVPITEKTPPNPYLDTNLREITTKEGLKLTKLNPAYMTRQLADISRQKGTFFFHITSLDPISPKNRPDPWEEQALRSFLANKPEQYELLHAEPGKTEFRYMAPLVFEKNCIVCHAKYGAAQGEISGGISVTIAADALIATRNRQIFFLCLAFSCIWIFGLAGIRFIYIRLRQQEKKREQVIDQLQEALVEVKQLSGLLPICCSCKKIRDDTGYWQSIEKYISEHSQAQFTHGLCQECAHKLYPEIYNKKNRTEEEPSEDKSDQ